MQQPAITKVTVPLRSNLLSLSIFILRKHLSLCVKISIYQILALSSTNYSPGFLQVLDFLEIKRSNESYLHGCALIIDAMSIRKQVLWDKKKHVGYVDYAGIVDVDSKVLATEVLVTQIVSYAHKFKCPIEYFLANKTSSPIQAQLLKVALLKLYKIGIIIRSINAAGTVVNFQSFKYLGCSFDMDNLITHFKHPFNTNNSRVYVIFDPCHMLKLARNAMGEKSIRSPKGNISWKFINNLHRVQKGCDFKFADSLTGSRFF